MKYFYKYFFRTLCTCVYGPGSESIFVLIKMIFFNKNKPTLAIKWSVPDIACIKMIIHGDVSRNLMCFVTCVIWLVLKLNVLQGIILSTCPVC